MKVLDMMLTALRNAASDSWPMLTALAAGIIIPWIYLLTRPPPSKICGTRHGPPITASRIRLRDGRYLAYKEGGVPKEQSKHKIIFVHPYGGSRHSLLPLSEDVMQELGVYIVAFDRPGYGESDPSPERSIKSHAEDIEQLADALDLGDKFYMVVISMGGFSAWSCLKYIPHRLSGIAMMAPVVNYWWPRADKQVLEQAFNTQCLGDRIGLTIAHYTPWLLHLWAKQKLIPAAFSGRNDESKMNKLDREIEAARNIPEHMKIAPTQQGISESLHRDLKVHFGSWDFFPGDLNLAAHKAVPVHVWQGDEDFLVPAVLQRHVCNRLDWVKYHELPGVGHFLDSIPGMNDKVVQALLKS